MLPLVPDRNDLLLKARKLGFGHRMRERIKGTGRQWERRLQRDLDLKRLEGIGRLTKLRGWYESLEDLLDDYLLRVDGARNPCTHMAARRVLLSTVKKQVLPKVNDPNLEQLDNTRSGAAIPAHLKELETLLMASRAGDDMSVRTFLHLLGDPEADSHPPPVTLLTGGMDAEAGLCFLYLSACGDSSAIPAKWLVLLWEAEGLAAGANSNPRRGEDYLNDFVTRNMIQVVQ